MWIKILASVPLKDEFILNTKGVFQRSLYLNIETFVDLLVSDLNFHYIDKIKRTNSIPIIIERRLRDKVLYYRFMKGKVN